jgi:ABC-2 type transport system permease protein
VSRLLPLVRREYLERVRSKLFMVSTLIGPLLVIGLTLVPGLLMQHERGKPLRIAIHDETGALRATAEESLGRRKAGGEARFAVVRAADGDAATVRQKLAADVIAGRIDGFVALPANVLETSRAEYYGKNVSNVMDISMVDQAIEEALVAHRLTAAGLARERVAALTRKLDLKTVRLTSSGAREDRGGTFVLAMLLLMMLYATVAMWGAAIMNGVIEEKANRVVEVIVSSVPPSSLFWGKLLGVGAAGLTQFLFWAVCMALAGLYGAGLSGSQLPEVSPLLLGSFVLYFLLGYFLYGAMYAAVGSAVNTQQEAQSLAFPVTMPLVLAVMFFGAVMGSPDSRLSVVLSLIPFLTPLLMFLRITVLTPPAWQIALSVVLMLGSIAVLTWLAARVYRVGILMYGKRPTFPEIVRWAREG